MALTTPEADDDYDDYDAESGDHFEDEFEDAMMDCHLFAEGGYWLCGAAGSEHCDWDCPFSRDIGKRAAPSREEG